MANVLRHDLRWLIVNADDYGLTAGISEGIRRSHRDGVVTSTSAMMNFPKARLEVARAVCECPRLGLGVHLVLSAGGPVRPAGMVASLLAGDGSFVKLGLWNAERWAGIDAQELRDEWRAQIDLFVGAAHRLPTHLDSHHHLAYLHPKALEVMLGLAAELNLPVRNPLGFDGHAESLGAAEKSARRPIAALDALWQGCVHPRGLVSNALGGGRSVGDALVRVLALGEVAEAMCHPGHCDEDLRALSSFTEARERELAMLTNPALRTNLAARGIGLATFAVLAGQ